MAVRTPSQSATSLLIKPTWVHSAESFLKLQGTIGRFLGPFYGAIAVPSVTRCRCRCCCRRRRCGHRGAGGVRQ